MLSQILIGLWIARAFLFIRETNGDNYGGTRSEIAASQGPSSISTCSMACVIGHATAARRYPGEGGSPWCLLGDVLIADGFARSVIDCCALPMMA